MTFDQADRNNFCVVYMKTAIYQKLSISFHNTLFLVYFYRFVGIRSQKFKNLKKLSKQSCNVDQKIHITTIKF